MKSSRVTLSALLVVLGGALLALGPSDGRSGLAIASDPVDSPSACLQESPAASQTSDAAGDEAPSHFDNGPVPGDELAGQPGENQGDYRFEYPESNAPETSSAQTDRAEHYYHKYGYQFATPGAPYTGDAGAQDASSTTDNTSACRREQQHATGSDTAAEDYTYDRKNFSDDETSTTSNANDAARDTIAADNSVAPSDGVKSDAPKMDEPKMDAVKTDEPKSDEPKMDSPKTDEPKSDLPVDAKNDATQESAAIGPADDMKDEAVATTLKPSSTEQRDGENAATQPESQTTGALDATRDNRPTYTENPSQDYGYQYGHKYGYRYGYRYGHGYEPSWTAPPVGGDTASANSSDVPAQQTEPVKSDTDANSSYQGYSEAYPDENYAYREDSPSTDTASDAGVRNEQADANVRNEQADAVARNEQADAALTDELEAKYQFSRRRHGEPGEALGRMFEEEPESFYSVPTSEYDGLDYFADEVRQAKAAQAVASAEQPTRDVAAESTPSTTDTLNNTAESVDPPSQPQSGVPAMQGQAETSNVDAPETNDSVARSDETAFPSQESGLELFAWNPTDLLVGEDQRLLRQLERRCEDPSVERQIVLDGYIESLGMEAIAFARRFEGATTIEVTSLADDLPGVAAFLASYRLVEQGKLGMDEAVEVARRSLRSMPSEWIAGVRSIATRPEEICTPQYAEAPVQESVASQPVQQPQGESRVCEALQQATVNVFSDVKAVFESIPMPQWHLGQ